MRTSSDERNRILSMVESGQITAAQAAQLLDALVSEQERPSERMQNRTLRIWMTDMASNRKKINVTATMPIDLISMSLRLLTRLVPQFNDDTIQNLIRAIERGNTGRLLDLQDLEEGKRVEIFVEQ